MPRTTRPPAARLFATLGLSVAAPLSSALVVGCAGGSKAPPAGGSPAVSGSPAVTGSGTTGSTSGNVVFPPAGPTSPGAPAPQATAADETLPKNKLATLQQGDRLINDGEDEAAQGQKLKAAGKEQEGEALIKSGGEKVIQGNQLKAKAATMAD